MNLSLCENKRCCQCWLWSFRHQRLQEERQDCKIRRRTKRIQRALQVFIVAPSRAQDLWGTRLFANNATRLMHCTFTTNRALCEIKRRCQCWLWSFRHQRLHVGFQFPKIISPTSFRSQKLTWLIEKKLRASTIKESLRTRSKISDISRELVFLISPILRPSRRSTRPNFQ